MDFISRGFRGRKQQGETSGRLPPGQYLTHDFPVLSAGPTPRIPLSRWTFKMDGEVEAEKSWSWTEFQALPRETVTADIHCVTKWSKLDTVWTGVSLDTLLEEVETSADYLTAYCDGGYTTNLPLEDVMDSKAWVVFGYDGQPLEPPHSGMCIPSKETSPLRTRANASPSVTPP